MIDRVWKFHEGYRVRKDGKIYRVNRWGEVERRAGKRPIRWLKVPQARAMSVRLVILSAFDQPELWGTPHEDRGHIQ